LVNAYIETGASTYVWLRLDNDDIIDLPFLPEKWFLEIGERLPLSEIYAEAFRMLPNEAWYGFIADDVVPVTPEWDKILVDIADRDGMAVPAGGHEENGAPHFVLGGDLVRSIGWLSLPGLDRLYIDTVWQDIAESRGVLNRVPEVVLEHHHFSNRKALMDETYRKRNRERDHLLYKQWRNQNGHQA
jgi:hypothetical protein